MGKSQRLFKPGVVVLALASILGACGPLSPTGRLNTASLGASVTPASATPAKERDCLIRAMYFESHRSSEDGLLAVGTVVMNRVNSPNYPDTICGVVGQRNQFAAGVLSRKMNPRDLPRVEQVADAVLAGKRHPKLGEAMFFHQAGLRFPYKNMHYVAVAGGNAFYIRGAGRPNRDATRVASAKPVSPAITPVVQPVSQPADLQASPAPLPVTAPASQPRKVPEKIEDLITPASASF